MRCKQAFSVLILERGKGLAEVLVCGEPQLGRVLKYWNDVNSLIRHNAVDEHGRDTGYEKMREWKNHYLVDIEGNPHPFEYRGDVIREWYYSRKFSLSLEEVLKSAGEVQ